MSYFENIPSLQSSADAVTVAHRGVCVCAGWGGLSERLVMQTQEEKVS